MAIQQINLNADPSAVGVIQILPVSDPTFPGVTQAQINADPATPGVQQANINFDPRTPGLTYVNFNSSGVGAGGSSSAILMESGSSILKEDMTGKIAKEQ